MIYNYNRYYIEIYTGSRYKIMAIDKYKKRALLKALQIVTKLPMRDVISECSHQDIKTMLVALSILSNSNVMVVKRATNNKVHTYKIETNQSEKTTTFTYKKIKNKLDKSCKLRYNKINKK